MAKARGINSGSVLKTLKDNNVKSRVELYSLRASKVGCVYLGDETIGSMDLADWKCSKGHVFQCRPNGISQRYGCPYCNGSHMEYVLLRNNCKTLDEYGHKIALENPNGIKYIGGFVNTTTKAEWECSKGHRWKAKPNSIKTGYGCPYCNSTRDMEYVLFRNNCKTPDEYGHKLALGNPNNIKYIGGFINHKTKAEWECSRNHRWETTPNSIKNGHGCLCCNSNDIKYVLLRNNCKTPDEYGHKIASENSNGIKYIGGFVSTHKKAEWECSKGHRWKAKPNDIQQGNGCPKCALQFSKKENDLFKEIQKIYPNATDRNRGLLKNTRYELDIFIPSLNKAVEFDGDFWHSLPDTVRRDTEKDIQCTEAGITLYRVKESDWDTDKNAVIKNVLEFLKRT